MTDNQKFALPSIEERPLVTFALFAYNQRKYIREAIEGAFAQTYEPLEIILSDDCSLDGTFELMAELASKYTGPHKIRLNRNKFNLGLIGHVNLVDALANGKLIVAAAGDDISMPHRVEQHVGLFLSKPNAIYSIHSPVIAIGEDGEIQTLLTPPLLEIGTAPEDFAICFAGIIGASHSWSRKIREVFGPITEKDVYEDLIIGFRSSLLGGIEYIDEPLLYYRVGVGISSAKVKSDTFEKFIVGRITMINRAILTFEQRKRDCQRVERRDLLELIDDYLKIYKRRLRYFVLLKAAMKFLPGFLVQNPVLYMYARSMWRSAHDLAWGFRTKVI